jgi:hypothetical protein
LRRGSTNGRVVTESIYIVCVGERLQLAASIELPDFVAFIVGRGGGRTESGSRRQRPPSGRRPSRRSDVREFHVDLGVGEPRLQIELKGNLAAMLGAAHPPSRNRDLGLRYGPSAVA